jgi:hypothetical protein
MFQPDVLHLGSRSEQCRALAAATNRRLAARTLKDRQVDVTDGPMHLTREVFDAIVISAWALGARIGTLKLMEREELVPIGVSRMIRNPGLRTTEQKELGRRRIAHLKKTGEGFGGKPKMVTAAQIGLSFQNLWGAKGTVFRGAGHYTAGRRVANKDELIAEMRADHKFHIGKGWGGLAYEAMVADDGTIGFGNPMTRKGTAVEETNTGMVNICCPGTTGDRMTPPQQASVRWLMDNWHTTAVPSAHRLPVKARSIGWRGHRFYPNQSTDCPGAMIKDFKEIWA